MNFKPFKMAQFSAQWTPGSLHNLHSSNPQPWTWDELSEVVETDLNSLLIKTPFAYEPVEGNQTVRELISHHYHSGLCAADITLTSGAQEGIFLVMQALINPDDHVITFSPCFEPLTQVAIDAGAEVSMLPLNESNGWSINWDRLKSSFKDSTKLVVINFPHNPTGAHISQAELLKLTALCEQHNCWLFSDEVFRGLEHQSADRISSAADLYDKAVSMGVVSKALALPGVRLGWLSCQDDGLHQRIKTIKSHLSICQSSLDAQLCQAIIPHSEKIWQRSIDIINGNKSYLAALLANNQAFKWHLPKASATAFIECLDSEATALCQNWAEQHRMLLLPNEVFLTDVSGFRMTLGSQNNRPMYDHIFKI